MIQGAQHQETGDDCIHIGKATGPLVLNGSGSHRPDGLGGEGPGLYLLLTLVPSRSRHPWRRTRQECYLANTGR